MKQKTGNALDGSLEDCIRALESSGKTLAHEMAVSVPQIKRTRQGGGETWIHRQFYHDLNETKDRECIEYIIRGIYQSLGGIGQTPGP
jgi:hypothetical protein